MKQLAVVVVPVYKAELSPMEASALRQLQRVLGRYPRCFMAPASLSFDYGALGDGFTVERFPDTFFNNTTGYSCLMLSQAFYERFLDYEYILIYQLDAVAFSDQLEQFCRMGYDYIGAPITRMVPLWRMLDARVGNGGFSLRRTAACLRMLREHGEELLTGSHPYKDPFAACEDAFFAFCGKQPGFGFRVPDVKTALSFAVQEDVQHVYRRMRAGWRPFGCHGFGKTHGSFWRQVLIASGIEVPQAFSEGRTFAEGHTRLLATTNGRLPLARLYGLLRRGEAVAALQLLADWLERYDEKDAVWQKKCEDMTYLWRLARYALREGDPVRALVEQALEEAVRRTLTTGNFKKYDADVAMTLFRSGLGRKETIRDRLHMTARQAARAAWEYMRPAPALPPAPPRRRRIVAITMVKNEMDVIESFVRHTLSFADVLLVADHQSSDRTREILASLAAEGLPVHVETVQEASYAQAEVMTHLLVRAARAYQADVVVPLDADEFLLPFAGQSCRALLESLPTEAARSLHWRDYAPMEPETHAGTFLLAQPLFVHEMRHRGQKVLVGGALARSGDVRLMQGNHGIEARRGNRWEKQTVPFLQGLEIAHFPWRSEMQSRAKYAVAWPNNVGKYTRNTLFASGYRASFEDVRAGAPMPFSKGDADWREVDLREFLPEVTLRYSEGTQPDPLANALAASEQLAETLAETRLGLEARRVTTILTYLGAAAPFQETLAAVAAEAYPSHELVVLSPFGALPETLKGMPALAQAAVLEGVDAFAALPAAVHGRYVEWLLPGDSVRPEKLRLMAACLAAHEAEYPLPLLLSDAVAGDLPGTPQLTFGVTRAENMRVTSAAGILEQCRARGTYPAAGLAGALMTRTLLEAAGWLRVAFADGAVQELLAFEALLAACSHQSLPYIGILWEKLGASAPLALADCARNQIAWQEILMRRQGQLTPEEQASVLDRQRRVGIALLERALREGEDLSSPLWQTY